MWLLLAGVWETRFATVFPIFTLEVMMTLFELFEAKTKPQTVKSPPPRNFVAKNAQTTGSGSHAEKKFTRKEKHKNKESEK